MVFSGFYTIGLDLNFSNEVYKLHSGLILHNCDCLCLFASDVLSHTFEASEPHIYSVLPLGHISESDSSIFCFMGVPLSGIYSVSPILGGRRTVRDSPVT